MIYSSLVGLFNIQQPTRGSVNRRVAQLTDACLVIRAFTL